MGQREARQREKRRRRGVSGDDSGLILLPLDSWKEAEAENAKGEEKKK